jgi:hypothetical protein
VGEARQPYVTWGWVDAVSALSQEKVGEVGDGVCVVVGQ